MPFKLASYAMAFVTAFVLFGSCTAHMYINMPVPFDVPNINNSPLDANGDNFPCKVNPNDAAAYGYNITAMNYMPVGETLSLNFTGSASHGGGTCQLAMSLDLEPTVTSTWKLFQVYEGGCPTTGDGNDGSDPFTFQLPDEMPNGRATFSWTWYNKIGNREIYMNCAPITVTGGSNSTDYFETLPNLYVINLGNFGDGQCESVSNTDTVIPNPGQFILSYTTALDTGTATPTAAASCSAAAANQTLGVSGYQSNIVSNLASYGAAASNYNSISSVGGSGSVAGASTTAAAYGSSSTAAPMSSATVASTAGATTSASAAASTAVTFSTMSVGSDSGISQSATAAQSTAAPSAEGSSSASAAAAASTASSSGNSTTSGDTCSEDGALVCNGESEFGICNFGTVVWQAVAAGTTCSDGQITKREDVRQVHVRRSQQLTSQADEGLEARDVEDE